MKLILGLLAMVMMSAGTLAQDSYKVCNPSKIYASGHPMLNKMYDGKVPVPKEVPQWPKGVDSLQAFFDRHITTSVPKETPIQRPILAFTVDCNGNPGDFQWLNKEDYPIQKEIMQIVKTEMEKWEPAMHKGNAVDCRVVILFSVANSNVTVRWKSD